MRYMLNGYKVISCDRIVMLSWCKMWRSFYDVVGWRPYSTVMVTDRWCKLEKVQSALRRWTSLKNLYVPCTLLVRRESPVKWYLMGGVGSPHLSNRNCVTPGWGSYSSRNWRLLSDLLRDVSFELSVSSLVLRFILLEQKLCFGTFTQRYGIFSQGGWAG